MTTRSASRRPKAHPAPHRARKAALRSGAPLHRARATVPTGLLALALLASAQSTPPAPADERGGFPGLGLSGPPRVEIAWNRFYDTAGLYAHFDRLVAEWPELLSMEVIGHSTENRELRVYTLSDPTSGPAASKPAMWIDANVHGNEVQGGETVLYTAWYLLENRGHVAKVDELLQNAAFYLLPTVNPDGRDRWIADAHDASSSRTGYLPTDNDRDGFFDEDPPNDLDGDGNITSMRKHVPGEGTHRLDPDDPRILVRVPPNDRGIRGDWILLGDEGIDDDGDGRVNEDGLGGYDMNRAWPSFWQPGHVQFGAGPYPLYWPETRSVARFLYEHPNVAAVQSFHNAGGMILKGPGVEVFGSYPRADERVYEELGRDGERMLPFYRYMVIWRDLYSVFGGFATWTYEGLGIISFTNEMWTNSRLFPDEEGRPRNADRHFFDDELLMGAGFVPWRPYDHPLYGEIEIGGFKKDVGRVPPSFLIEEELHRNALFCLRHARAMPLVTIENATVTDLGGGLKAVDAEFHDRHAIPTRTARAAEMRIGTPDRFTLGGRGLTVVAGGFRTDRWRPEAIELAEREPARLVREAGIEGRDLVRVRWFVRGSGTATVGWQGEKARDVTATIAIP